MKRTVSTSILLLLATSMWAQLNELMMVEYVDWTTGSGMAIKIHNPTGEAIDLSTYTLNIHNNGSIAPTSAGSLMGMLAAGDNVIVANSSYETECPESVDIVLGLSGVNDEDVVTLFNDGEIVDAVGALGYTENYQVNGEIIENSLKWVKLVREEANCIRYTSNDGQSVNSWPTSPDVNFTGWQVQEVTCLDPSVAYEFSGATIQVDTTICEGDSLFVAGEWRTEAGLYNDTLTNQFFCDSIISTNLQIVEGGIQESQVSLCAGDSIFLEDAWQTTSGVYSDTLFTEPCLAVEQVEVTVQDVEVEELLLQDCEAVEYDGEIYESSEVIADTLVSVAGCDSVYRIVDIVIEQLELNITGETVACGGETIELGTAQGNEVSWSTGEESESISVAPDSTQWISATLQENGCTVMDSVMVEVSDSELTISPGGQITIQIGDTVSAGLNVVGAVTSVSWEPAQFISDSTSFSPLLFPVNSGNFVASGTDVYGCTVSDTLFVEVMIPEFEVKIPNIITPNNDDRNDRLVIEGLTEQNSLWIFDRWGREVFAASPYENNWDGEENHGTFYVILKVSQYGESEEYTGTVTVVD